MANPSSPSRATRGYRICDPLFDDAVLATRCLVVRCSLAIGPMEVHTKGFLLLPRETKQPDQIVHVGTAEI